MRRIGIEDGMEPGIDGVLQKIFVFRVQRRFSPRDANVFYRPLRFRRIDDGAKGVKGEIPAALKFFAEFLMTERTVETAALGDLEFEFEFDLAPMFLKYRNDGYTATLKMAFFLLFSAVFAFSFFDEKTLNTQIPNVTFRMIF